jgi:predicted small secreted protein
MRRLLWLALLALPIAACDTDRGAQKDLPVSRQNLDETDASVYLFPDGFPNITHKCDGTTGLWTTTDRGVWIVYEDRLCDGDGTGMVLDNIPGSQGATE